MNANVLKRPISDPHFHLWSPRTHSWLNDKAGLANHSAGDLNSVGRDYGIPEFLAESNKYSVDASVHIQCYHDDALQETVSLQSIAESNSLGHPHGIMAYAELESADFAQTLAHHMKCANFRGIRQCVDYHAQFENRRLCPRDDLLMDSAFHDGLRLLAQHGLLFDLQLFPSQLRAASVMAAAHPTLGIIVNHCGFPMLNEHPRAEQQWLRGLELMAQHQNVSIKKM